MLIGLAGPAAMEPALRARLADRYTETLTGTLRARGELARALQLPGLGNTEVVQVIKEYLSGLIENSPVKDVFAAWAGRIAGGHAPGPPAGLVIPDPERLKDAAAAAASSEVAARPVTDPGAVRRFLAETAMVAAVDLANQVRYLQEGDGPCHGCARPEAPADRRGPGPEDHPVRPPEFIP